MKILKQVRKYDEILLNHVNLEGFPVLKAYEAVHITILLYASMQGN